MIIKESTESFASNWPDIVRKAGMQLDCPETGIIHLYPLIKKAVCIDCTSFQVFKLGSMEKLSGCDEIISDQLDEDVVESTAHRESSTCPFELSSGKLQSLLRCV